MYGNRLSEPMNTRVLVMKAAPLRVMALLTSNGYQDRDAEYVATAALKRYVSEAWKGGVFRIQPLLFWHDDPPIGEILYAETKGTFLIELARELPDAFSRKVWDLIEADPAAFGVSHGFQHYEATPRGNGRVYHRIKKFETSVLPLEHAANPFTGVEV